MGNGLFGGTMPLMERTLDLTNTRHKLISSNIANEETPGYKSMDIDFQRELTMQISKDSLKLNKTHAAHLPTDISAKTAPKVNYTLGDGEGLDGNTVNLEKEMVKMSQNSVWNDTALTILAKKFAGLKSAINDTR